MRAQLRQIAAENQAIVDAGRYKTAGGEEIEVASVLSAAVAGTRSYDAAELAGPLSESISGEVKTTIEVTGEDTVTAARRLAALPGGTVAALNFASARHPGGGFLTGAKAQEEDLCRKTLLFWCLLAAPDYYAAHQRARDPFYSHRLIYSPGVPIIRDNHNRTTAPMVTVDMITCAAPNAGVIQRYRPELVGQVPATLVERSGTVLEAAARHGARRLVLGAWGCGVFRNDPRQVAAAFRTHLTGDGAYRDVFEHVTFAVLDRSAQQRNLGAFRDAFGVES
jgi:uncharacterized protein (TIGR02452 family)